MAIEFRCPFCRKLLTVADIFSGRSGMCTGCNKTIAIPNIGDLGRRSDPAPGVSAAGPRSMSLHLTYPEVTPRLSSAENTERETDPAIETLRAAVVGYLDNAGEDVFRNVDLQLTIWGFDEARIVQDTLIRPRRTAHVSLRICGVVNDAPIDKTVSAKRGAGRSLKIGRKFLEACLLECTGEILGALDEAAERPFSEFSLWWRRFRIFKWAVCAGLFLAQTLVMLFVIQPMEKQKMGIGGRAILAMMASSFTAGGAFGVLSLGALLFAPGVFLKHDPAGIRVMVKAGVRSTILLRVLALFLGLIFLLVFVFGVFLIGAK
jgi:hypothetical protein